MTLHTKILATLWIVTVVMWLVFWAMPSHWTFEHSPRHGFARGYAMTAVVITVAAVIDAVLYCLMWVWG